MPSKGYSPRGASNLTGSHTETGYRWGDVRNAVGRAAIREALHNEGIDARNRPTMCPLCSQSHVSPRGVRQGNMKFDPVTGQCLNATTCAKRRAELDDETIEFLGLTPRAQ
jgi:hypothetical protein